MLLFPALDFNNKGIFPTLAKELKKSGKQYFYLRINKNSGADKISNIIQNYKIPGMGYKVWSSETILKKSKPEAGLKREND